MEKNNRFLQIVSSLWFSSNILSKPYNYLIKYLVEMPSSLESIIIGVLISDGSLKQNKSGNTLLLFKQSPKHFEYL
jgi:hypothetical protein